MTPIKRLYYRYEERFRHRFKNHDDAVILSYPKAGRTWLRVMLERLGVFVEWSHSGSHDDLKIEDQRLAPMKEQFRDRKAVILIRDPRDIIVSSYFQYHKRENKFAGSISEFIRDEVYGIRGILDYYHFWIGNSDIFSDFIIVSYESMVDDTRLEVDRILSFINKNNLSSQKIDRVIHEASFDKLKKMEATGSFSARYKHRFAPTDGNDPESFKVRRGKIGGFVDYLDASDIDYCNAVVAEYASSDVFGSDLRLAWLSPRSAAEQVA